MSKGLAEVTALLRKRNISFTETPFFNVFHGTRITLANPKDVKQAEIITGHEFNRVNKNTPYLELYS